MAIKEDNLPRIQQILDNDFPISTPILNGMTAFMVVAAEGSVQAMIQIAQRETDFNRRDRSGRTALHLSCFRGDRKMTEAIFELPGI